MNACRKVCGPTSLVTPPRLATRRTTRAAPCRSSRCPSGPQKIGPSTRSPTARSIARAVRVVRRVARRAGITKPVGPHTLRHAFITAALDAGVPLRDVQEAAFPRA